MSLACTCCVGRDSRLRNTLSEMATTYGWLDVHRIAEELADAYPPSTPAGRDPLKLRFVELRAMVEKLPGFAPDPAHPVNEKILEAIQMAWVGEKGEDEE